MNYNQKSMIDMLWVIGGILLIIPPCAAGFLYGHKKASRADKAAGTIMYVALLMAYLFGLFCWLGVPTPPR